MSLSSLLLPIGRYVYFPKMNSMFSLTKSVFRRSLVDTDMGRPVMDAAKGMGMEPLNVQQSVDAYLQRVSSPMTFHISFAGQC